MRATGLVCLLYLAIPSLIFFFLFISLSLSSLGEFQGSIAICRLDKKYLEAEAETEAEKKSRRKPPFPPLVAPCKKKPRP